MVTGRGDDGGLRPDPTVAEGLHSMLVFCPINERTGRSSGGFSEWIADGTHQAAHGGLTGAPRLCDSVARSGEFALKNALL
jgi:hypothetical protein